MRSISRIGGKPLGIFLGKISSNSCKRNLAILGTQEFKPSELKYVSLYKSKIIGILEW